MKPGRGPNDPSNPFGEPGHRPERDPASGRHEGAWANCFACNSTGRTPGIVRRSNGYAERAEFIRVQIRTVADRRLDWFRDPARRALSGTNPWDWAGGILKEWICEDVTGEWNPSRCSFRFARGFVASVTAPLAVLIGGGECGQCRGDGWVFGIIGQRSVCLACHGTGRTHGVLAEIVRRHPVETVRVTDRKPMYDAGNWDRKWMWHRGRAFQRPSDIPDELYYGIPETNRTGNYSFHDTAADATTALSSACLARAKS